jgi:hypothetical protein
MNALLEQALAEVARLPEEEQESHCHAYLGGDRG